MIYVSTGGSVLPFARLVKKMDEIAGEIDEEVIIQGGMDYSAKHAKYANYFSREKADDLIRKARIVISHAGIGTIICAIQFGTPIIIVPRLKELKEHFNDHQMEITKAIGRRRGIKVIYDVDNLKEALNFSEIPQPGGGRAKLIQVIKSYVDNLHDVRS